MNFFDSKELTSFKIVKICLGIHQKTWRNPGILLDRKSGDPAKSLKIIFQKVI